jgi:hypothetical protein
LPVAPVLKYGAKQAYLRRAVRRQFNFRIPNRNIESIAYDFRNRRN